MNTEKYKNLSIAKFAELLPDHKWSVNNHITFLDGIISKAIIEGNSKIIINMPPRHGKTAFCSEWLPLWFLNKFRTKNIMLATYNQKYATHLGRRVKDLISKYKDILQLDIRNDANSANNFVLGSGGGMLSIGAGGTMTGRGADLLLIDDPIKNDAQANSQTYRDNVWNWFNATAFTRIEPNGSIIVIMTRWHQDDLTGRIINSNNFISNDFSGNNIQSNNKQNKNGFQNSDIFENKNDSQNKWTHIILPAIAGIDDQLGRDAGEPLWDKKFNLQKLNQIKLQIGEFWFASLYQQNPLNPIGNIFKRKLFRYFFVEDGFYILQNSNFFGARTDEKDSLFNNYMIKISDCSIFAVADLATTTKQTSDYTVIIIFAITPNEQILILDVIRKKFDASQHLPILIDVYSKYKPVLIGIEAVQYQISLVQMARKYGLPVKELKPDKDKISRALPMTALLENEKVFFLNDTSWLTDFENEILNFPNSKYDDQVDAFAYITYMISPILSAKNSFSVISKQTNRNSLIEY